MSTQRERNPHYRRNLLRATLLALIVGVFFIGYVGYPWEYASAVAHPAHTPLCCITPADRGMDYQDVRFTTTDGLTLRGWYIPSHNRAAIIVIHGSGGNRVPHIAQAEGLSKHGYGVLLMDSRSYGESDGNTITLGGKDVLAAVAFLQTRGDIDRTRIGALGYSLGGMVSIQAAAASSDLRAVISDGAGPTAFEDEVAPANLIEWVSMPGYWMVYKAWELQGAGAPLSMSQAVTEVAPRPLFLIAAGKSRLEVDLNRRLYALASEPKTLWEIPDVGHVGGWDAHTQEYTDRMLAFFDQVLLGMAR